MQIVLRSVLRKTPRRILCCVPLVAFSLTLAPPLALGAQCRDLSTQEVAGTGSVEWPTSATQPYYSFKAGGTVFVRDKANHREVLKFEGHKGDFGAVMHPDRPRLLIEGGYRLFQMRELPSGQAVGPVIEAHSARFIDDRFLDLGRFFDRMLLRSIVEANTGREVLRVPWFVADRVTAERTLLAHPAADERQIIVLDLSVGRELSRIDFSTDRKNWPLIAFIGDAHIGIAARHEQVVRIYELASGREVAAHRGHAAVSYQAGRTVLMGGDEGVELLDSPTGRPRLALPAVGHIAQLVKGTNGKPAVIATYPNLAEPRRAKIDATVLWEPLRGEEIARWASTAPMLSPTGGHAALFRNRGAVLSVRIVDTANGRELCADELNAAGHGWVRWVGDTSVIVAGLSEAGRGRVLFLDTRRAQALAARAGSATEEDRVRAKATFSEAFAAFQRGDFDQAMKGFKAGLALDAANAPAQYYLGETHLREGRRAEAVIAFQRARELAPDSREAAQAGERLAQLGAVGAGTPGTATAPSLAGRAQDSCASLRQYIAQLDRHVQSGMHSGAPSQQVNLANALRNQQVQIYNQRCQSSGGGAVMGDEGRSGGLGAVPLLADPEHARLLVSQAMSRVAGRSAVGSRRHAYIDATWNWGYLNDAAVEGLMVAAIPKADDVLIDLDSGSGAVPLYAALRFGLRAVGIQPDPEVAHMATEAARELGIADRVRFVSIDPLAADLSAATIVTINGKLRKDAELVRKWVAKLRALPRTVRIASSTHNEWNWVPDRVVNEPPSGKGYIYPTGLWLGRGER